jgi:prephenate dehydrogenase
MRTASAKHSSWTRLRPIRSSSEFGLSTSLGQRSPEQPFGRITIVGLGLVGGSLARALSALDAPPQVVGWSPSADERGAAAAAGVVAEAPANRSTALADAELVVLAAPLDPSRALLGIVAEEAPPTATISDVVSLKGPMAVAARACGLGDRWVGCHPMAGSEASGFAASRADLFAEARVWTVADGGAEARVPAVHRLWEAIGARPERIDAVTHDRLMALASHLPQLVSTALANVMASAGVQESELGPGGRDMTRLAGSSVDVWRDLLACAPIELSAGLRSLAEASDRMADRLDAGDFDAIVEEMERAGLWRGAR